MKNEKKTDEKQKKPLPKEIYLAIFFGIVLLAVGALKIADMNKSREKEQSSIDTTPSVETPSSVVESSEVASSEEEDTRIDWNEYAQGKSQSLESNGIKGYTFEGEEGLTGFPANTIELFKKNLQEYWKDTNVVIKFVSGTRSLNERGTYTVKIIFDSKDEYDRVETFDYISDDDGETTYHISYH